MTRTRVCQCIRQAGPPGRKGAAVSFARPGVYDDLVMSRWYAGSVLRGLRLFPGPPAGAGPSLRLRERHGTSLSTVTVTQCHGVSELGHGQAAAAH